VIKITANPADPIPREMIRLVAKKPKMPRVEVLESIATALNEAMPVLKSFAEFLGDQQLDDAVKRLSLVLAERHEHGLAQEARMAEMMKEPIHPLTILAQDIIEEFLGADDPPGVGQYLEDNPGRALLELAAQAVARSVAEGGVTPEKQLQTMFCRTITILETWKKEREANAN
jgi:hypothetical protein